MSQWQTPVSRWTLRGTVATLPLATSLHEISLAVLLAVGLTGLGEFWLWLRTRPELDENPEAKGGAKADTTEILLLPTFPPWLGAAFVAGVCFVLGALPHGNWREGLGHAWLLAPLLAIPLARITVVERELLIKLGLAAASIAAITAVSQWAAGRVATGAFGHHLTLAYALVPPFAAAVVFRRWGVAALLAAGSLASGSDAVPISLMVAGFAGAPFAARFRRAPEVSLAAGVVVTCVGMALFANKDELRQRAVLWTGGLSISPGSAGSGGYGITTEAAYDRLSPGFYFPNHAHDSAIQLYATVGPAGCVAIAVLLATIFQVGGRAAAAGLAGVLVGGLTQDVLGDLEVARAVWVWTALCGVATIADGASADAPAA